MPKRALNESTLEPISLAEAKKHVAIESTEFDAQFDVWIKAARRHCESRTHRVIARQKWRLSFNSFPSYFAAVPAPVHAVDSVNYIDTDDDAQVVDDALYVLDLENGIIRPVYGETWPTARGDLNSVWVDVWSGYASTAGSPLTYKAACPADLKAAMLLHVGDLWDNRSMQSEVEYFQNRAYALLIDPYWLPE